MNSFNSFAKINFFLNISGIYKNSYHKIKSIFCEIDLCDIIEYEKNSLDKIRVFDKSNILPEDNLLLKASNKFIENINRIPFGVDFYIEKRIPIGGGLGGGSSNASAVLKILNRIWKVNFSNNKLEEIGSTIGSDVPFFIKGKIQAVYGTGNILKKLDIKKRIDIQILLIIPELRVSTPDAYKMLDESNLVLETFEESKKFKNIKKGFITGNFDLIINNIYNKFEQVVFKKYPLLKKIKEEILDTNAVQSFMSGSGSTMIGIYKNEQELLKSYNYFKEKGYNVYITKINL